MAYVQTDLQEQQRVATRTEVPLAVWGLIGMLALVMVVTTGLAVVTIVDDDSPAPEQVKVPVPVAVDARAAKAMKDESKAAAAISETTSATITPGEVKTDAAFHALSVSSIALQRQRKAERDLGAPRDDVASGTAAKDEAAVAAAIAGP